MSLPTHSEKYHLALGVGGALALNLVWLTLMNWVLPSSNPIVGFIHTGLLTVQLLTIVYLFFRWKFVAVGALSVWLVLGVLPYVSLL